MSGTTSIAAPAAIVQTLASYAAAARSDRLLATLWRIDEVSDFSELPFERPRTMS